jgi:energy-coupling factor transporter transmembrane protein EcfT
MKALRIVGAVAMLAAVAGIAGLDSLRGLALGLLAGLTCYLALARSMARALRAALPVLVFALSLTGVQIIFGMPVTNLAVKTVASFFFITSAFRIYRWANLLAGVPPLSPLFTLTCYLLFVRHFSFIFTSEAIRLLQARSLCITKPYGRGSFRSLVAALVALFERSLLRAERFYAAQSLRGLAE